MKKTYLLLVCSFVFSIITSAQSGNAVIFTELGEKFTAYLNGEKQNDTPSNNVKIDNLTSEFYQVRIDFEDDALPDFHNNNFAIQFDAVTTYMVKANKKGSYVLRFHNSTAIEADDVSEARPNPVSRPVAEPTTSEPTNGITTNVQITETTTQQTTTAPNGETINISMNVGGNGINLNMNVDESNSSYTETVQTTTQVTTSASGSVTKPVETEEVVVSTSGCAYPMNAAEFSDAKKSIQSKSFEDSKFTTAKQITKGKCLTADQVKQVMLLFDFEETRLDFAKFAFDYTFDTDNYYKVNDAFDFEMTIEELDEYLQTK